MDLRELENKNIDYVIEKNKIILLEFYTSWCPACKLVGITLEEFEENHPEVFILQVNVDEFKDLANIYKIKTAPTILFFSKGKIVESTHGIIEIDELEDIINKIETD